MNLLNLNCLKSAYKTNKINKNLVSQPVFKGDLKSDTFEYSRKKCEAELEEFVKGDAPVRMFSTKDKAEAKKIEHYQLIPEVQVLKQDRYLTTLYAFKFDTKVSKQVLQDLEEHKVNFPANLQYGNDDVAPFTFKKYVSEDGAVYSDYPLVDLENPDNQKILKGKAEYRNFLKTLPFEYSDVFHNGVMYSIIDMTNPKNKELLDFTSNGVPTRSQYFGEPSEERFVPVQELVDNGFANVKTLVKLAKEGEFEVKVDKTGDKKVPMIKINLQSYQTLFSLRGKNPDVSSLKSLAKQLGVPIRTLKEAIFRSEVDLIQGVIFPYDEEAKYINLTTPKNKEFVQKVEFEQELKRRELEQKREFNKQERIKNKDFSSRLNGVRMSLVWKFMPDTVKIASDLAKKDGYIAKLLAKEDDPKQELTKQEQISLNKYRKEVWLKAGVEELSQAHKSANEIMEIFKTQGLSAIEPEYREIFAKYGFVE